jgi:hypothetical protein
MRIIPLQAQGVSMSRNPNIWIERDLVSSPAFQSLKTAAACRVLLIFFTKRQFSKIGRKGKESYAFTNNGELVFTYPEALDKYGMKDGMFRRAIDELRNKGFLDIIKSGAGLHKSENYYSLSDRWRKYGTLEYQAAKPRPVGPINKGFRKGNRHGQHCRKVEDNSCG